MSVFIGILIGLVLGLTGSGGAILAVPLLIFILHLEPAQAIGMSLGVVAASTVFGVINNLHTKTIQWAPALIFSAIGSAFTPLGHSINKQLPPSIVMLGFSAIVIVIACLMWIKAEKNTVEETNNEENSSCDFNSFNLFKLELKCIIGVVGGAAITGTLSGLFGVGGGFIIVPTLILLLGLTMEKAVATSLLIISFVSTAGFINYALSTPVIDLILLAKIIAGGAVGMLAGQYLSHFISGPKLQKLFVIVMIFLAFAMIAKQLT